MQHWHEKFRSEEESRTLHNLSHEASSHCLQILQDVVYAAANLRAMSFIGGGAETFQDFFEFLGTVKDKRVPPAGSPFQINFPGESKTPKGMAPANETVPPCWDSALKCSCGDCPDGPTCTPVRSILITILQDCITRVRRLADSHFQTDLQGNFIGDLSPWGIAPVIEAVQPASFLGCFGFTTCHVLLWGLSRGSAVHTGASNVHHTIKFKSICKVACK